MANTTNFQPGFSSSAFSPDLLVAGDHPIRHVPVTIISGQNLARGAVLGKITASGKHNLSASAAGDGSNTPVAILIEAVDATSGDKKALAYIAGDFNANQLILGAGHTVATIRDALAQKSIYIHTPVVAE